MYLLIFFVKIIICCRITAAVNFTNASFIENTKGNSIDLCYICDRSLNTTFDLLSNINESDYIVQSNLIDFKRQGCWEHGVYDLFCLPTSTKNEENALKGIENDRGHECKTFISIMPPRKEQASCNVNIFENNGKLEDVLTITKNGSIKSTNNSWYPLSKSDREDLKYTLVKRIPSKKSFEGKQR